MSKVQIRYDLLIQEAFRSVIRSILLDVSNAGLRGDHHYFIRIDCTKPDVGISDTLRNQYPDEITIVLQHQYWDLIINEKSFEVTLQFAGVAEKLVVPFHAIKGFSDPSVNFALQFDTRTGGKATASKPAQSANVTNLSSTNKVTNIGRSRKVTQIRKVPDVLDIGETKPAQITTIRTKPKPQVVAEKPAKKGAKSSAKGTKTAKSASESAKTATKTTKSASTARKKSGAKTLRVVKSPEKMVEAKVVSLDNFRKKG